GYFRCHTTRRLGTASKRRLWPTTGTGEDVGAVATATAKRVPSGENTIRVNLRGPAAAGIDGQDPSRCAVRDDTPTRYTFVLVPLVAVATASRRPSGENVVACAETGPSSRTGAPFGFHVLRS